MAEWVAHHLGAAQRGASDRAAGRRIMPSLCCLALLPVRRGGGPTAEVGVVGPVCESGDVLARGRRPALPRPGDVLAVMSAGAYGFVMSSTCNSRPRPAEVLVDGDRFRVIRDRETIDDLVRGERI